MLSFGTPVRATAQDVGLDALEQQVVDLFERSCARSGCHAGPVPQQGMMLTRDQFYASIVGEPSRERPALQRVHPGQPEISYLVMKVKGAPGIIGSRMPLAGDGLSDEDIRTIEQWIARLDEVDERRKQQVTASEPYPFDGWKIINLPTTRALDAGSVLFLIGHRFNPKISDGYDALFGLDGSGIIYLSVGHALTDDFLIALGRSNASDNVELQARYRIARQDGPRRWPVAVSAQAAVNWISEKPPGESRYRSEAFKFTGQVSLAREIAPGVGVAVVPGLLINPAENVEGEDPMVTLGLGGRWRFYRNLSLVGEWVPILSGFTRTTTFGNDIRFDSWGGGLEITTGGHVFQIVVSNTVGLTTDQYLRGGDLDITEGDLRLGFNIFRILNF
ncbi:MAG: DUF5777 family beta-barrel protein [Rhodothermales bacterium]